MRIIFSFSVLVTCFIRSFRNVHRFREYVRKRFACRMESKDFLRLYRFLFTTRQRYRLDMTSVKLLYSAFVILADFLSTPRESEITQIFRRCLRSEKLHKRSRWIMSSIKGASDFLYKFTAETRTFSVCLHSCFHNLNLRNEINNFSLNRHYQSLNPLNSKTIRTELMFLLRKRKAPVLLFDITRLPLPVFDRIMKHLSNRDRLALLLSTPELFRYCRNLISLEYDGLEDFIKCYGNLCPIDMQYLSHSLCFCQACNPTCPCQTVHISEVFPLLRLLLKNFHFRNVVIKSNRIFELMLNAQTYTLQCQNLFLEMPLNVLQITSLRNCTDVKKLSFILPLDEILYPVFYNFPKVKDLCIQLNTKSPYRNVYSKTRILRQIIRAQNQELESLQISNFSPSLNDIFPISEFDYTVHWFRSLTTLTLTSAINVYCSQFTTLFKYCKSLAHFSLTFVSINPGCEVKHFFPVFRSDRYNFSLADSSLQRPCRESFLNIDCEALKCAKCTDIPFTKYIKHNLYRIEFCEECKLMYTCL